MQRSQYDNLSFFLVTNFEKDDLKDDQNKFDLYFDLV